MADQDTVELAKMIYSEAGSTPYETQVRVGSTALNRLESGRAKEFGASMPEVLQKGYYAVSKPNKPMEWATTGKFPNADEENRFKKALQISYGLKRGTIKRGEGLFYFKPKEESDLKAKGKKVFNFDIVKGVGKDDTYKYYSY